MSKMTHHRPSNRMQVTALHCKRTVNDNKITNREILGKIKKSIQKREVPKLGKCK